jgi:hypothetical protein
MTALQLLFFASEMVSSGVGVAETIEVTSGRISSAAQPDRTRAQIPAAIRTVFSHVHNVTGDF